MKKITLILFLLISSSFNFQSQYPLNKRGEPSRYGIAYYVKQNEEKLISEFQKIVNDTLYDVYIYTSDLGDSLELGCFYIPNEVVVTDREKFIAYEYADLSENQKNSYIQANNFVKAAIFHELMHYYFSQVIREMRIENRDVSVEYNNFSMVPRIEFNLGARFIEEGICEYFIVKTNQCKFPKNYYVPRNISDIHNQRKRDELMYEYSVSYVKSFVDYFGYKKAIQILVSTKPPTYEEILYPAEFFSKIEKIINK